MKYLLLLIGLCLYGCTSTTLEVASVPSIKPWDSVPDTREYTQNKSLDKYIEFSSVHLSLLLTNYETKYRGNAILGIEMERWPDSQFNDDEIILALGIKPLKLHVELIANNIVLIMKVDGVEQHLKPYRILKFKDYDTKFCGFDNSFGGWGTRSVDVGDKEDSLLVDSKFADNCYNLYFKFPEKVEDVDFALDFSGSLLPLDNHQVIYFHKKLIKWRSSN
ncbi:hypothetical protein L5M11_04230 [Shewanella sp. SM87]|uniref:hypothetical protein n=1 Tax=unclassified Shewanella TaxID=196818 RepID=UPI0021D99C6A|nr:MULTISPECIES: hypothetical protein [unclassified Shewanella]MCU8006741.1 hypothetical protein [Shewanella sp. SM87]MCU8073886.1 hypothetical protein [Shewanella sp. SM29]